MQIIAASILVADEGKVLTRTMEDGKVLTAHEIWVNPRTDSVENWTEVAEEVNTEE